MEHTKAEWKNQDDDAEENSDETNTEEQEQQQNSIVDMGSVTTKGKHLIHCLTIIGQVEGALYPAGAE